MATQDGNRMRNVAWVIGRASATHSRIKELMMMKKMRIETDISGL